MIEKDIEKTIEDLVGEPPSDVQFRIQRQSLVTGFVLGLGVLTPLIIMGYGLSTLYLAGKEVRKLRNILVEREYGKDKIESIMGYYHNKLY